MRMERHDLAALSAEELELFAYLLEEAGLEVDSRQPIVPRTLRSGLPLSFAQQRLWFLDQLQPGSSVYHIVVAVRLRGPLDPDAVARSLAAVVARHESLRTTFAMQDDQPVQVIAPTVEVPLPVVEVPPLPAAEREAMVAALVRAEVAPPFDLRRGPLIRARLLRLEQHDHILVLTLHHIVSDGWSQGVLLRELTSFYRGYAQNEPVSLPTLPIQYADYVLWQRAWMAGAVLEAQLAYWRRQLAGVAPLDLPTDYPRPQVAKDHGAIVEVVLPAALSAQIIRLSQQLGSTLFMTLLAAFQILLARYSEQDDIAVGSPIAGRVLPELEGLIGFFANTLVLRTDLAGQPTFAEVVARVRTMTLDAFAHQDLPFEKLVEDLQPERDPSRTPLFQVMFALQNAPRADVELPHLRLEPVATITQTAKFDLSLSLVETPAGIRGQIEYRADLFVALTIARMAAHFQTLLAAIVGDPSRSIDRLPLLTAAERAQIQGWEVTLPTEDACLHWLIEVQAKRVPASIAVEQHGAAITYAELDRRANQLAHHLRSLGVGPDVAVGLCLPRSIAFVVALLGVLKAGGCYVPLDPAYPQERLQLMLADSAARVLITQESLLHPEGTRLPGYTGTIVYVNRDAPQLDRLPTVAPRAEVQPDHVMLILYTSGSTGAPKGVLLTHRNLVSYLRAIRERCPLRPADRLLQLASISFDISAEDLFTTLTIGATVVLRTEALLSSPETFEATCARERITVLNLPTAFWHVLAEASESGQFTLPPSVRHVIIGGEHAALDRVRQWQARYGERASLLNSYGPTETTIGVTAYLAPTILPAHLFDTPIGRALVNVRTYVLDARLEPVPIGVPGELYIGGVQLARGYLNRPDLTAARFIPDPLSRPEGTRPGARLYRTGDRVRAMADGTLIFLGRADTQVKLRGFRVELGEIAAVLRQHPAVRDVVVLLRDERLVAYVVEQRTTEQRNK
ncbi:MAG TPA: amino acid adenylation domain-containing protein, partial [Herpetosiphonaceae bacterium]